MSRRDKGRLCLFPAGNVRVNLSGRGRNLTAEITWLPPRKNAALVGGYVLERTTWWPGRPPEKVSLTRRPVRGRRFFDRRVKPDLINEYRVIATHKSHPGVTAEPSFPGAVYGFAYLRYADMVAELKRLARDNPDICRLVNAGPASNRKYRIWCMVLGTDTSDYPDKPGVFLHANAHAAENQCSDVCLGIIRESIRRWRRNDPVFTGILRNIQARVIPMYNPFGRSIVERGFPGQARKSSPVKLLRPPVDPLRIEHCWSFDGTPGLDPNRCFDVEWRKDRRRDPRVWGRKPLSLPETRALVEMALALRPQISIDYHAPCGVPLYPAKWPDRVPTVDQKLYIEVARNFNRLSAPTFPADCPEACIPHAIFTGWGTGWFLKEFYGVPLCPEGFYEQMPGDPRLLAIGPSVSLDELVPRNTDAFAWMADRVQGAGITVHVVDEQGRPVRARVEIKGHMDRHCADQLTDVKHGSYRRLLLPGKYTIVIDRPGFAGRVVKSVRVDPGRNTRLDVVLEVKGRSRS